MKRRAILQRLRELDAMLAALDAFRRVEVGGDRRRNLTRGQPKLGSGRVVSAQATGRRRMGK